MKRTSLLVLLMLSASSMAHAVSGGLCDEAAHEYNSAVQATMSAQTAYQHCIFRHDACVEQLQDMVSASRTLQSLETNYHASCD